MDPHFRDAVANRFAIAEIAKRRPKNQPTVHDQVTALLTR
jgi:hypothetical protein